jgi:hypothetical protein
MSYPVGDEFLNSAPSCKNGITKADFIKIFKGKGISDHFLAILFHCHSNDVSGKEIINFQSFTRVMTSLMPKESAAAQPMIRRKTTVNWSSEERAKQREEIWKSMEKYKYKTAAEAEKHIHEFDYDPSKEKDGPVATNQSVNKTLIAFYKVSDIVQDEKFLLEAVDLAQRWVKSLNMYDDKNDAEEFNLHF